MKTLKKINALFLTLLLIFAGCDQPNSATKKQKNSKITPALKQKAQKILQKNGQLIPGQYIVVYNKAQGKPMMSARNARNQTQAIQSAYHIPKTAMKSEYTHSIRGFTAKLNQKQLKNLKNDRRVNYIEQDRIYQLTPPHVESMNSVYCIFFGIGCQEGGSEPQVTPYGVQRVGGPAGNISGDHKAWVIDTGIDLDHDDLNVDAADSKNFYTDILGNPEGTADDEDGHGTNVAGIIAAKNNDIDVVGVAPGTPVVAVRVLGPQGSGSFSGIINGVDYVASKASPGDVANMSLGGSATASHALDDAVKNAASEGIYFAIAAGNDGENANNHDPARIDTANVYVVSAINSLDEFASFSNFGNPPIDFAAPGVGIKSLWKNNGTNTESGTSQATPHVAGVLLVTGGQPNKDGTAKNDPDGNPDPIVHE